MSLIKRRHFLQFAGSTLAAVGLSQADIVMQGDRYGKLLAQSTPRKLALLVGINDYPDAPLYGCATDVDLQRQLLTHRFGFDSSNIYTLVNQEATRQNILTAFEEHLIKQAKPGDVVVFHFSGHGSRVKALYGLTPDGLNSTLVPIDATLPAEFPVQGGSVQDIMGHTLFLLVSALQTENVTVVLDSCYSGGTRKPGNFRVRSRQGGPELQVSASEKDYQQQWMSRLKLTPEELAKRREEGPAKGLFIASAQRDQLAMDGTFDDFHAGAFTYLMTQYLWQQTSDQSVSEAIGTISRITNQLSSTRQEPLLEIKPGSPHDQAPVYFSKLQKPPAEAVITEVQGQQARVWLGGIDLESLEAFGPGATFSVIEGQKPGNQRATLVSRQGLTAQVRLEAPVQKGTLLQEVTRTIPDTVELRIGLDSSLEQEAASAKQALQGLRQIVPLDFKSGAVPFEGEVHYILGRMTPAYQQQLQAAGSEMPAVGSYGLFAPGFDLIPGSFGAPGETAIAAITRLQAKFKSLLAARLVKLTLNGNASRLDVSVSMRREDSQTDVVGRVTRGGTPIATPATRSNRSSDLQKLPLGTPIQFRITNNEPEDLYVSVLVIDPAGEMTMVFPNRWTAGQEAARVAARSTLSVPDSSDGFALITVEPKGVVEVLAIASYTPLDKALKALEPIAPSRGFVTPPEPVEVMGDLVTDLSRGTRSGNASTGAKTLDTTRMATLSITFEVV